MKALVFAERNRKELMRDPLSYLFCLGLPLLMLVIMTIVNSSIPPEAQMTLFRIDRLAPGIAMFSLTFTMLFGAISISKDRSSAFLIRLYASPLRAVDFVIGYTLPLFVISVGQLLLTFAASAVVGLAVGIPLPAAGMLFSILTLLPAAVLFLSMGMIFGTLFHDKAAPPVASIVITLTSILGGVFMDVDSLNGALKSVCAALPFYHGVRAARAALQGDSGQIAISLLITILYAAAVLALAALVFSRKRRREQR